MSRLHTLFASLLFSILVSATCVGQDSLFQIKLLSQSKRYFHLKGLPIEQYAFDDAVVNAKLLAVLNYDHKAQQKTMGAGILTGLSIVMMTTTFLLVPDDDLDGLGYALTTAPILFMSGVACGVASIPLWIASGKQRKARDAAIAEANELLMR